MPLSTLLREVIAQRGAIPFRDFMEFALYHPDRGYYGSGRAAIGRGGDFFTNVSVGPLFGALLARQFEQMWLRLGRPERFTIVEQGAHCGDFARDVLAHFRSHSPVLLQHLRYTIIEPSPRARAAQFATLGTVADRVHWVGSPQDLEPFTGVHFSNELIDAFPVHLVKRADGRWLERHVEVAGEMFRFIDLPPSSPALADFLATLPEVPDGYITEVNLAALEWIDAVATRLERGFILAIDYGYSRDDYYRPERSAGTLSAYAAHRREPDPLARPGEIDLTAHVDFTSLAGRGLRHGLALAGFTDQHHLMVGLSRLHFSDTETLDPAAQKELRALQTLMHPTFMGRAFKALCLSRGLNDTAPLAGFEFAPDPHGALALRS